MKPFSRIGENHRDKSNTYIMSTKTKILITGANGLLGQSLVRRFASKFDLYGCDLFAENYNPDKTLSQYEQIDLTQKEKVQYYINQIKPGIIINTAAFNNVDLCEEQRDQSWAVNVKSVESLLESVTDFSTVFVQISTDYVFNGKNGLYKESDSTDPLCYYGHTKLAAEKIVANSGLNYIIVRSQILYGWGHNIRNNFLTWVIKELKNNNKIRIVNDQIGNPTYIDDLSEAIFRLLAKKEYGVFHVAGNEICSRFEFAVKIAQIFNLDSSNIEKISSKSLKQKAPRPKNSSFNLDKLSNTLDWLPGDLQRSLQSLRSQQA
jgi:dTDP-4-dehydrorhamnose reductase